MPDQMTDETRTKALKCPLMGRARALEKARVHYGGDVSLLVDLARNALVFQSLDDLNAAVDRIIPPALIIDLCAPNLAIRWT